MQELTIPDFNEYPRIVALACNPVDPIFVSSAASSAAYSTNLPFSANASSNLSNLIPTNSATTLAYPKGSLISWNLRTMKPDVPFPFSFFFSSISLELTNAKKKNKNKKKIKKIKRLTSILIQQLK